MRNYNSIGILGVSTLLFAMVLIFPQVTNAASLYRQLQLGMSGSDVSDLQTFLAKDSSVYPQGLVTGYFGSLTQAAVSKYQAKNGLSVVGRVGPLTMAKINSQMGGSVGSNVMPIIGPLTVSTSTSGATINWNTTNNTSASVYYSTSPINLTEASPTSGVVIGGSSLSVNNDFTSSHSANLNNLASSTTYYYVVYVKDASGNENITWPATFRTNQ
jgi:peptidoglycan hydrolase-like protein with peptidoglycan-binding domain